VLVNGEGGAAAAAGDKLAARLAQAFDATEVSADIRILAAAEIADAIRGAAASGGRIVIAGGDGTANGAAQILVGSDAELALLPLGTLNHLARDLGIPNDLEAAAQLAAHGRPAAIDIGRVNDHVFVNNASIGVYPSMVRKREKAQRQSALPKWLAAFPASWEALSRLHHHRLRIDMGEGERPLVTPLLFVGNNAYSLDAGSLGSRETLRDGRLSVYAVAGRSRLSLIWFALRALVGRIDRRTDFVALGQCRELTVRSPSGSIEIALDGEVRRLASPLRFEILPAALRVVAPPAEAAQR
jgi:diacylglycerol kinase family enzyme